MSIKTVGLVGTGVIGSSWAVLFLARGLRVVVSDPAPAAKQRLEASIREQWPLMQRIGLSPDADPNNWQFVENVADHLSEVDYVQENAPENRQFKEKLFAELDAKAPRHVILASSSSGLPSSQFIGSCANAPDRILIGHPFNPPHLIPLVEVVPHSGTSESAVEKALDFYRSLGKSPILVKQELPGFVANRLQAVLNAEAMALVNRGIVSAEDVDAAVTSSLGLRWAVTGPMMSSVLGGGGNRDGFLRIQKSIGRAAQVWLKDVADHSFEASDENLQKVDDSLQQWLNHVDMEKVTRDRDEVVLNILDTKTKSQ
ncbi:hypothetical protein SLS62_001321 [Diatrype stigma]|uniref:3-hydroxyacyl-CoA dehydrogenase n=1 Tax=Diatrype stigma TaxID=117547 RepID=A0AAN9V0U3_9PEZI